MQSPTHTMVAAILLAAWSWVLSEPSCGQESVAIAGEPFGVAHVTIPLDGADQRIGGMDGFQIREASGRVFYPVFGQGWARRLLGEVGGAGTVGQAAKSEVYFLFKGTEPLELTIETSRRQTITLTPTRPRRQLAAQRVWRQWWREYSAMARQQETQSSYPPVVETYLTSMLSHRLGFAPPLLSQLRETSQGELQATIDLLLGVERLRYDMLQQAFSGRGGYSDELTIDLPEEIAWQERPLALDDVPAIEPMAEHVPAECLYVRFGSWQNQVWLKQFAENQGARLTGLVSLRSFDNQAGTRLQEQIAVQDSKFIDLVGGNLIADVALIGTDAFVREGASMGIILQARNSLLGPGINRQRVALQKQHEDQGATLEIVEIGGVDVSLLSTPDNQLRSYYVVDGKFHFTTNSETLVRRFLEAGQGVSNLAGSAEFQLARMEFPLERDDTIFVYLSSAFFRNLLTPKYQIELQRRLQSVIDIETLMLARLAGSAEGIEVEDIANLERAGLLPPGFGTRPDGSQPVQVDGEWIDSVRGRRGYFLPIADAQVGPVSESEYGMYLQRAEFFAEKFEQLDPVILALQRIDSENGEPQRLEFEARIQPFGEEKYGWLFSLLGPPLHEVVRPGPRDVVRVQASVKGGLLLPATPPHQLMLALTDDQPIPLEKPADLWSALDMIRTAPGYIGGWPKPGFLDLIPIGLGAAPDANGFTRSLLGVHRWQGGGFSLLAFDKQRLIEATEGLEIDVAETPAHLHLEVGDLARSQLRPWFEQLGYWRARESSLGNTRLLNQLDRQLKVPVENGLGTAEQLLDVTLLCPLGGSFELIEPAGLSPRWRSTALLEDSPMTFDLSESLDLMAGAEARMLKLPDRFVIWGKLGIHTADSGLEEIE